jgi:hypothetical protein
LIPTIPESYVLTGRVLDSSPSALARQAEAVTGFVLHGLASSTTSRQPGRSLLTPRLIFQAHHAVSTASLSKESKEQQREQLISQTAGHG